MGALLFLACGAQPEFDQVTIPGNPTVKDLELILPDGQRLASLEKRASLIDEAGIPVQFERVVDAERSAANVYVIGSGERRRLRRFRWQTGVEIAPTQSLPERSRLDALAAGRAGWVVGWDRRRAEAWQFREGFDPAGPVQFPISRARSNIDVLGDTVWAEATLAGDHTTLVLERGAFFVTLDEVYDGGLRLPDIIQHQPAFAVVTSQGALFNFSRMRLFDWSPRYGLAWGDNSSYRFGVSGGKGAIVVSVDHRPVALTTPEKEWWEERAGILGARSSVRYEIPRTKPAYRDLWWDDMGRVWIWRYTRAIPMDSLGITFPSLDDIMPLEVSTFDVFDDSGAYLWTLELPPRTRILAQFSDHLILAKRMADLGNREIVEIYRVQEGP